MSWPQSCRDMSACERHRTCLYRPCPHYTRAIGDEIDAAVARLNESYSNHRRRTAIEAAQAEEIPTTTWSGTFTVFGVELKCHVLSNGQRVVEADSMHALMDRMEASGGAQDDRMEEFAKWQMGR